jgi:LPS export ABC transporter protein LptC
MSRPGIPILVLILLGVLISFFRDPAELISPTDFIAKRERALPQTYVGRARSLTFDEHGRLTEIMEARTIEHFEQRDESLLDYPRFYSHNGDEKTWSATADRGRFQPSTEALTLESNVVLTNDASGGRLDTEQLTILLADRIAFSEVEVTVTHGLSSMRADGMHADLEQEQISMNPNVESLYVRPE